MHLSVVVPAYNEERDLENNIKTYLEYLDRQEYDYELIIVNDGSGDTTARIASRLATDYESVKFIDCPVNQGKGAAVRKGFNNALGDYALFLDADNATSIDHLDKVWPLFAQGFDIVIGSRSPKDAAGAVQIKTQAVWKRLLGKCGNRLIQLFLVWGIWDTQCGFKIFKKNNLKEILPKQKINRWAFDAEMLTIANKLGYRIGKIPVSWKNADITRVGVRGYIVSLREVLSIAYNKLTGKYS